jgi:hypothetical protein
MDDYRRDRLERVKGLIESATLKVDVEKKRLLEIHKKTEDLMNTLPKAQSAKMCQI